MKLVIGADHRGYAHKEYIKRTMTEYQWIDVGAYTGERSDYPEFAHKAVIMMREQQVDLTVLLCGSGIGVAIVANRYKHIRAGIVWNTIVAQQAKAHDNINVLALPADYISEKESIAIIQIWIETRFLAGRYAKRITLIEKSKL